MRQPILNSTAVFSHSIFQCFSILESGEFNLKLLILSVYNSDLHSGKFGLKFVTLLDAPLASGSGLTSSYKDVLYSHIYQDVMTWGRS
jgi:hypothetical protein